MRRGGKTKSHDVNALRTCKTSSSMNRRKGKQNDHRRGGQAVTRKDAHYTRRTRDAEKRAGVRNTHVIFIMFYYIYTYIHSKSHFVDYTVVNSYEVCYRRRHGRVDGPDDLGGSDEQVATAMVRARSTAAKCPKRVGETRIRSGRRKKRY